MGGLYVGGYGGGGSICRSTGGGPKCGSMGGGGWSQMWVHMGRSVGRPFYAFRCTKPRPRARLCPPSLHMQMSKSVHQ